MAEDEVLATICDRFRFEPGKVKGSRHIATAVPVVHEAGAKAVLREVSAEMPDANHHCFAWRLGRRGEVTRSSDDGEPSGSAGRPILNQILGHGLSNVVVVVTRYFGGTKLGVGGLIRAYGEAAKECLSRCEPKPLVITRRLAVVHGYMVQGVVDGVLAAVGLKAVEAVYSDEVAFALDVPEEQVDEVAAALRDACAGQIRIAGAGPEQGDPADDGDPAAWSDDPGFHDPLE